MNPVAHQSAPSQRLHPSAAGATVRPPRLKRGVGRTGGSTHSKFRTQFPVSDGHSRVLGV
jgi:hypothetical protein